MLKMKTSIAAARYVSRFFVLCTAAILVFASCARAQFGGTPASSQSTPVTPLPLSGRTSQNGSVVPVQTPVPGTTTSVDTLNPSVQVQGPYSGSANSTARDAVFRKVGIPRSD